MLDALDGAFQESHQCRGRLVARKVQNDITWQRFQILPETQSVRYENQYMVEQYFQYIKMQLPALTGTVFENLGCGRTRLDFGEVVRETGLSLINKNDTTSWWRKLRTAEEREANRHPNRSSSNSKSFKR